MGMSICTKDGAFCEGIGPSYVYSMINYNIFTPYRHPLVKHLIFELVLHDLKPFYRLN